MNYWYSVDYINTIRSSRLEERMSAIVAVSHLLSDLLPLEISVFWIVCQMFAPFVQNAGASCPQRGQGVVLVFGVFFQNNVSLKERETTFSKHY